ncbi:MAG: lipoprotein signal peptidase [Muribaculaceae bacterium]|nr:lipoprotein signal peptidase [Muribaculaceae bacterium]
MSNNRVIRTRSSLAWIIIIALLIIDQAVKIYIKTSFYLGESHEIFSWFQIRFIENPGMAFGMELGSKLFLTLFRIIVVGGLIYYMGKVIRHAFMPLGYVICLALIVAGAAGNIFDCLFYGMIFNNPMPPQVASFVPWGEGYAPMFYGKVVDMLYFPLFSFTWPEWLPVLGGKVFSFFDPVFNIADSAISVGMVWLIVFYHNCLGSFDEVKEKLCRHKEYDDRS